ncbi:hypothetical protein L6R53_27295 [Myxococcota bacterium]|nr:hypothetical protein [Myxococcota bacterium]
MSALILTLALSGCDLWRLDDDTGGAASACPAEQVLASADLPCQCGTEVVSELPYEECKCTLDGVLSCRDGSTDTGMWPTARQP